MTTAVARETKSPDATPAGNIKNMAYRVPPELLKGLPSADQLLHGMVIAGEERVIYHRKHSMLLVKASDHVQAVVSQRVDRLQSQAQQKDQNTPAEKLADALEKAFSKITPDIVRELLRQADVLIQEGKYTEAKNLLRASERRVKEELAPSSADEREQWLGLQS